MTQRSPLQPPTKSESRRTGRPPSVGDSGVVRRTMLGLDLELAARVDAHRAQLNVQFPKNGLTTPDILRMLIVKGLDAVEAANDSSQMKLDLEPTTTTPRS